MARNQNPEEKNLQNPVEETTEVTQPAENPAEPANETAPVEPEVPAENSDENSAPANEEAPAEWESTDTDLENTVEPEEPKEASKEEAPAEEKSAENPVEAPKGGKVEVKEPEYKYFDTIKVPAKIKKIIDFYGITSKDLFDGSFEKMKLKKEEVKALKEWYATLI